MWNKPLDLPGSETPHPFPHPALSLPLLPPDGDFLPVLFCLWSSASPPGEGASPPVPELPVPLSGMRRSLSLLFPAARSPAPHGSAGLLSVSKAPDRPVRSQRHIMFLFPCLLLFGQNSAHTSVQFCLYYL